MIVALWASNLARAEADVDAQIIANVRANCAQLKTRLRQLRVNDALSRVNYGQIYESISSNVITPTNARLVANNLKPVELISISSDYDHDLAQFRRDYLTYEEKLSALLSVDCQTDPRGFYQQLTTVRNLRQANGNLLKKIDQAARQYQTLIREMKINEAKEYNF